MCLVFRSTQHRDTGLPHINVTRKPGCVSWKWNEGAFKNTTPTAFKTLSRLCKSGIVFILSRVFLFWGPIEFCWFIVKQNTYLYCPRVCYAAPPVQHLPEQLLALKARPINAHFFLIGRFCGSLQWSACEITFKIILPYWSFFQLYSLTTDTCARCSLVWSQMICDQNLWVTFFSTRKVSGKNIQPMKVGWTETLWFNKYSSCKWDSCFMRLTPGARTKTWHKPRQVQLWLCDQSYSTSRSLDHTWRTVFFILFYFCVYEDFFVCFLRMLLGQTQSALWVSWGHSDSSAAELKH